MTELRNKDNISNNYHHQKDIKEQNSVDDLQQEFLRLIQSPPPKKVNANKTLQIDGNNNDYQNIFHDYFIEDQANRNEYEYEYISCYEEESENDLKMVDKIDIDHDLKNIDFSNELSSTFRIIGSNKNKKKEEKEEDIGIPLPDIQILCPDEPQRNTHTNSIIAFGEMSDAPFQTSTIISEFSDYPLAIIDQPIELYNGFNPTNMQSFNDYVSLGSSDSFQGRFSSDSYESQDQIHINESDNIPIQINNSIFPNNTRDSDIISGISIFGENTTKGDQNNSILTITQIDKEYYPENELSDSILKLNTEPIDDSPGKSGDFISGFSNIIINETIINSFSSEFIPEPHFPNEINIDSEQHHESSTGICQTNDSINIIEDDFVSEIVGTSLLTHQQSVIDGKPIEPLDDIQFEMISFISDFFNENDIFSEHTHEDSMTKIQESETLTLHYSTINGNTLQQSDFISLHIDSVELNDNHESDCVIESIRVSQSDLVIGSTSLEFQSDFISLIPESKKNLLDDDATLRLTNLPKHPNQLEINQSGIVISINDQLSNLPQSEIKSNASQIVTKPILSYVDCHDFIINDSSPNTNPKKIAQLNGPNDYIPMIPWALSQKNKTKFEYSNEDHEPDLILKHLPINHDYDIPKPFTMIKKSKKENDSTISESQVTELSVSQISPPIGRINHSAIFFNDKPSNYTYTHTSNDIPPSPVFKITRPNKPITIRANTPHVHKTYHHTLHDQLSSDYEMMDYNYLSVLQSAKQHLISIKQTISASRQQRALRESQIRSFRFTSNPL